MVVFEQSSGKMYEEQGDGLLLFVSQGYSGFDAGAVDGKNNPAAQGVEGVGPIPQGIWVAVKFIPLHPKLGKDVICLSPDPKTRSNVIALDRDPDSFFMHGDSVEHPGSASHGCIIMPHDYRLHFWNSTDRIIGVVAELEEDGSVAGTGKPN